MHNKTLITIIYNSSNLEDVMLLNNIKMMKIKKIHRKTTKYVINNEIWYLGNNMRHYKHKIKSY